MTEVATTPDIEASLIWKRTAGHVLSKAEDTYKRASQALARSIAESLGVEKVSLNFWWGCPTSPINACAYDDSNDPYHDHCLYCHDPSERK